MKKISYILLLFCLTFTYSCNFLDVVPDEVPTEADAFKDRKAAERFLYSCYSYLPDPRDGTTSIDFFTADEVLTPFEHESFANFPKGNYTAVNPVLSYWNTLFRGIRQCYILLDRLNNPVSIPGLPESEKNLYIAESTFLVAYYHFLLLRCYGPILIVEDVPDVEMAPDKYSARKPYDSCVIWISNKFDEAANLGLLDRHTGSAYGRATSIAAKAIKARMLLYAASPLFNGGYSTVAGTDNLTQSPEYINFKTASGDLLINHTYDANKWQIAADAFNVAINAAHANGIALYNNGATTKNQPEPSIASERKLRMTICDRETPEMIWTSTRKEGSYALQNKSTPFDPGRDWSWNGIAPTLAMVEQFYTANGLPINEDPSYVSTNSNKYGFTSRSDTHTNGATSNINLDREPRFYAWVGYHNGYYEVSRASAFRYHTQFMKSGNSGMGERSNNYSPTGYLNKKGVHPLYAQGSGGGGMVQYPWPIIRLGELYLSYAEALIEVGGDANLTLAKDYIDSIRIRAGIPTVDNAWSTVATLDQNKLRQIVRQERTIELYLENQRFWDIRRWLLGKQHFNIPPRGLSIKKDGDDFFTPQTIEVIRKFNVPAHYLMPVPISDIDKNPKVVQNPGY